MRTDGEDEEWLTRIKGVCVERSHGDQQTKVQTLSPVHLAASETGSEAFNQEEYMLHWERGTGSGLVSTGGWSVRSRVADKQRDKPRARTSKSPPSTPFNTKDKKISMFYLYCRTKTSVFVCWTIHCYHLNCAKQILFVYFLRNDIETSETVSNAVECKWTTQRPGDIGRCKSELGCLFVSLSPLPHLDVSSSTTQ